MNFIPAPRLPPHLLKNCRILSNRHDILQFIPKQQVIAEIGVALGDFSQAIMRYCDPSLFLAVDTFILHTLKELWGRSTKDIFGEQTHLEYYTQRFATQIAENRTRILEGDSSTQIATLLDSSVDVFYVDGDHTYDGVRRDLLAIKNKIKDDGFIILNDYIMNDQRDAYGVIQATNEFMMEENWEMVFFCLEPLMYCDVVLRKTLNGVPPIADPADIEAQISYLQQTIAELRASTSWKVTAPLRMLKTYFKKLSSPGDYFGNPTG